MKNSPLVGPAQPPVVQPQKSPEESPILKPQKKPKNKLVLLLIFLLMISSGLAGFFGWKYYQLKQEIVDVQPMPDTEAETDETDETLLVSLDEEFTLHENQSAMVENEDFKVKIIWFSNSPCPDEVVCVWGGVGIFFEYSYKGEVERGTNLSEAFGYEIPVIETDYETFAILKITKIE